MRIISMTLIISLLSAGIAIAEYNPATGEDDLVFINAMQEVKMGNSLSRGVEDKFGLLNDSGMQERVNEIGQRIARICDRPELIYSFRVLDGEDLDEEERHNAFALPGGYVYIFKEMVEDTESDDELAAVLAHEVGHIVAKHSVKKLQSSIGMTGLSLIGAVAQRDNHTQRNTNIAIIELMMAYSRQAEFEADKLSVQYLREAGFDPNAAVTFVDRMLEKRLRGKIVRYHYFRTHPYTSERKAMLNKETKGRLDFDDYINTTSEAEKLFW